MTYEPAGAAEFRSRLLHSPGERRDVDYKASNGFVLEDAFSLKLIRHIIGFANVGGGWLIIGFKEEAKQGLVPDPAHSAEVAATYDPTRISQAVNTYLARGQQLSLTIFQVRHDTTGLLYPEIKVDGFARVPFVCRSDKSAPGGEQILRQGVVYVRRAGAETSVLSTPNDWEEMIGRCVRQRRDEFLEEFRDLFERMTGENTRAPVEIVQDSVWLDEMRRKAGLT